MVEAVSLSKSTFGEHQNWTASQEIWRRREIALKCVNEYSYWLKTGGNFNLGEKANISCKHLEQNIPNNWGFGGGRWILLCKWV